MRFTRVVIGAAAILLSATPQFAQDKRPMPHAEMNKYVVSAKAGVVNLVEGDATVSRLNPLATPEMLLSGDELRSGDTVRTGSTGRAEILLNPGCYLRLGAQTEFVFLFDDFISDKIKLVRGSAVLEASALEGSILVETPKASFEIARDGLYRFNVGVDGRAEVAVRKGRAVAGGSTIKEGKSAVVEGSTATIAKLNKKDADPLDDWSKDRAKALIALNSGLSTGGMSRTLGMSFMRNAWIYDPFCRCYTFLPFAGGFSSPYGWDYPVCNPYGYYYSRPRYNGGGYYGGGNGGGTHSGGGSSGGNSGGGGSISTGGGSAGGGGSHAPSPPAGGGGVERGSTGSGSPGPRRP